MCVCILYVCGLLQTHFGVRLNIILLYIYCYVVHISFFFFSMCMYRYYIYVSTYVYIFICINIIYVIYCVVHYFIIIINKRLNNEQIFRHPEPVKRYSHPLRRRSIAGYFFLFSFFFFLCRIPTVQKTRKKCYPAVAYMATAVREQKKKQKLWFVFQLLAFMFTAHHPWESDL